MPSDLGEIGQNRQKPREKHNSVNWLYKLPRKEARILYKVGETPCNTFISV